jgi:hypothetical protein
LVSGRYQIVAGKNYDYVYKNTDGTIWNVRVFEELKS